MLFSRISYLGAFALVLLSLISFASFAATVKKSNSGICHTFESKHYQRTKNYTSYESLSACIDSGGRLPKGSEKSIAKNKTKDKYSRKHFGSGWADLNKDCKNARHEALIAQSLVPVEFKTDKKCKVDSGRWTSSFSGNTIYRASDIDIDHVVPLSWAWQHGANTWTREKRIQFANDPANLLSVEASLNRQKGDKGPVNWLPPKNQCQYIVRFTRVMKKYQLNLTASEQSKHRTLMKKWCE